MDSDFVEVFREHGMDTNLVREFTVLHAKAKAGGLDGAQLARWNELKRALIDEQAQAGHKPPPSRPISRPG